ncbi:MAG: hypothetical protein K2M27_02105 [Muribaculaceae bacterium]|nr:hypothetical protein [Muribaculaceae bacterium]
MKTITTITKWNARISGLGVALICALAMCGCHEDDVAMTDTQLPDVDWNDVEESIFLNGEYMRNASAQFVAIPGSDMTGLILSGIHPSETIEMEVTTSTRDNNEGIDFSGEQTIEGSRHIKVEGLYRPRHFYGGTSEKSSMMKMKVSYEVPNSTREYVISFNDKSGFCYKEIEGSFPNSKPDVEQKSESCRSICKRINSEFGKHVKSLSFKFEDNGNMTLAYTSANREELSQTFRYWIEPEQDYDRITVENGSSFYETLLNALTPADNRVIGDMLYLSQYESANLFVAKENAIKSDEVIILDDLHHKIFPYLYVTLLTDGSWTSTEKTGFNTIEEMAKEAYPDNWRSYRWAFCNN